MLTRKKDSLNFFFFLRSAPVTFICHWILVILLEVNGIILLLYCCDSSACLRSRPLKRYAMALLFKVVIP